MSKIKAPEAWDITTGGTTVLGDDIVVAVLDGGFDLNHEDINFWVNDSEIPNNSIDDDGNGYVDDVNGWNSYNHSGNITPSEHGTHVAGIVGAIGNNNAGVAGVNWNVKIMAIQASSGEEAVVLAGYEYALKMRKLYNQTNGTEGAFVVVTNASFSTHGGYADEYPLWCEMYNSLGEQGVLSVNAPWNRGEELGDDFHDIPGECSSEYLVVVTNTDMNDDLNNSAPWGRTLVDLAAPGTNIFSTIPSNDYDNLTGTSMAAPHVAGAISLLYAAACEEMIQDYYNNPSSVALTIKQFLFSNSDPIFNLLLKIGYGRLNVYKSIIRMSEQYDLNLYLTGTETVSRQYDAISGITAEDYTVTGGKQMTLRAGQSITLLPNTVLQPSSSGYVVIRVDENGFNCAIEIPPLSVDLIAPEFAFCGSGNVPISVNAVPTGGVTPYNFVWFSRVVTSSNWVTHNMNSPNVNFGSSEAFFVKVEITDDRGTTVMSATKLINCLEAKTAPPEVDTTGMNIIDLADIQPDDAVYTSGVELRNREQAFSISPNPTSANVVISFFLETPNNITIQIYDSRGYLVETIMENRLHDFGEHALEHETKSLSAGVYFYTITTNNGFQTHKLIIAK